MCNIVTIPLFPIDLIFDISLTRLEIHDKYAC